VTPGAAAISLPLSVLSRGFTPPSAPCPERLTSLPLFPHAPEASVQALGHLVDVGRWTPSPSPQLARFFGRPSPGGAQLAAAIPAPGSVCSAPWFTPPSAALRDCLAFRLRTGRFLKGRLPRARPSLRSSKIIALVATKGHCPEV
jgi:hypothetical protein